MHIATNNFLLSLQVVFKELCFIHTALNVLEFFSYPLLGLRACKLHRMFVGICCENYRRRWEVDRKNISLLFVFYFKCTVSKDACVLRKRIILYIWLISNYCC
jgi:hypothetical protein